MDKLHKLHVVPKYNFFVLLYIFAGTIFGCTDQGDDSGANSHISVLSGEESVFFRDMTAVDGNRFVDLGVEIYNGAQETKDMPVSFALFSLVTDSGKVYLPSEYTSLRADHCSTKTLLTSGSSTVCHIIFEVPIEDAATQLRYQNQTGKELTAPVKLEECTWCGKECISDFATNQFHCGECYRAIIPNEQSCIDGEIVCLDSTLAACDGECVDLSSSSDHCGSCNSNCSLCKDDVFNDNNIKCDNLCKSADCAALIKTVYWGKENDDTCESLCDLMSLSCIEAAMYEKKPNKPEEFSTEPKEFPCNRRFSDRVNATSSLVDCLCQ